MHENHIHRRANRRSLFVSALVLCASFVCFLFLVTTSLVILIVITSSVDLWGISCLKDLLYQVHGTLISLNSIHVFCAVTGDALTGLVGQKFSTRDQDNDAWSRSCAVTYKGAWWYSNCHSSNLNGAYLRGNHTSYADGVEWSPWKGQYYSLRFTEMKFRPFNVWIEWRRFADCYSDMNYDSTPS